MSDFDDVGEFHRRFCLPVAGDGPPRPTADDVARFRLKFLAEELAELAAAYGYGLKVDFTDANTGEPSQDIPGVADALVDLVYVALGTAHLHGLPWPALWDEVQRANMAKVRAVDHEFVPCRQDAGCGDCAKDCGRPRREHSARGSALDVVKPAGWAPPDIAVVLGRAGWRR